MAKHSIRRTIAIIAAACVWLAAILQALQSFGATGGMPPSTEINLNNCISNPTGCLNNTTKQQLDPASLRDFWSWRRQQLKVDVAVNIFTAAGLLGLSWCVLILERSFKRYRGGESDLPDLMVGCFLVGAIVPCFNLMQSLGVTQTATELSTWNDLPDTGLQALHIAYTLQKGSGLYMFSCQFFFIPIGLWIASHLSFKTGELPRRHAAFGIITGVVGFITFIAEVASYNMTDATVGVAYGVALLFYGIILLPIWTIALGVELKNIKQRSKDGDNGPIGLTGVTLSDQTAFGRHDEPKDAFSDAAAAAPPPPSSSPAPTTIA